MKQKIYLSVLILFLVVFITACGRKNITHISNNSSCPDEYIFDASFDVVWKAAIEAVSEQNVVKFMDRTSGLITTELKTVDGKELRLVDIIFMGKTYKYTYTINLSTVSPKKTLVRIDVKLIEKLAIFLEREDDISYVDSYLRAKLFRSLCGRLSSIGTSECDEQFARYTSSKNNYTSEQSGNHAGKMNRKMPDQHTMSIQQSLLDEGYDPGPVDGFMGMKTAGAIKNYQRNNGLAVTGTVTQELLLSLGVVESNVGQNPANNTANEYRKMEQSPDRVSKSQEPLKETSTTIVKPDNESKEQPIKTEPTESSPVVSASTNVEQKLKEFGVITENTELKAEADPFSETVILIAKGTSVEVIDKSSFWLKVQYEKRVGYVLTDLVRIQ